MSHSGHARADATGFPLPIDDVLAELSQALDAGSRAVLVAPPGAGKTTRVPLALLSAEWLAGGKILVLEPRRIAARGAAERMARTLGERVGETVGLRARLDTRVGAATRIEVVTEGVFTRMLLDDPELQGVGAVLFDEFHERSLDADLGLALALDAQKGLREDLRLLIMSATLEAARVGELLGGAAVVESLGRAYPVETRYLGRAEARREDQHMISAIRRALAEEEGSILVFLPGQAEIARVARMLQEERLPAGAVIAPLYGALMPDEQDRAVAPARPGERKIVLATSIAETSLTIEGVRIVIDSGLSRVPRFEPGLGITRLVTQRASRASVDQRRGRAGRTEPGVCYRLWDEPQTLALPAASEPEILAADLSGLLLDCAEWGVTDIMSLDWLDPPPRAALSAAAEGLRGIGALDESGAITRTGRDLRSLPLPPRLAAMVLAGVRMGEATLAAEIAAVLTERGLGGNDLDLTHRVQAMRGDRSRRAEQARRLAKGWAKRAEELAGLGKGRGGRQPSAAGGEATAGIAGLLAVAYPDRIAKRRGMRGQFLLANGRGGLVDAGEPMAGAEYLVVAELQGAAAATRILSAVEASEADILAIAGDRVVEAEEAQYDTEAKAVRCRFVRRLGAIVLASETRAVTSGAETALALAEGICRGGVDRLSWSKSQRQLRDRVAFVRAAYAAAAKERAAGSGADDNPWPDLSDGVLAASAGAWLAPFLGGRTKASEVDAEVLGEALAALLPWPLKERLEAEAPTHFEAPTGSRHAIDYEGPGAPAVSIRVQELFGLREHPSIAGGRLPLTLNLLSPAQRPIQITRDLPGFWAGSWAAVKSEMKGRYPKHVWPDDPASAAPTQRAKPRGT